MFILTHILRGKNADAKQDALRALIYVSDGDDDKIQTVLDMGIINVIIELLNKESNIVTPSTFRTIQYIVSGNIEQTHDEQTHAIIDT